MWLPNEFLVPISLIVPCNQAAQGNATGDIRDLLVRETLRFIISENFRSVSGKINHPVIILAATVTVGNLRRMTDSRIDYYFTSLWGFEYCVICLSIRSRKRTPSRFTLTVR